MVDIVDMRCIFVMFLILCLVYVMPIAAPINIDITIKQNISGNLISFNIKPKSQQSFHIIWSNTGTVPCKSLARIVIFSNDTRILTLWSDEQKLMPSQEADWTLHSDLPNGSYMAHLRVYQCNEIFNIMPVPFSVHSPIIPEKALEMRGYFVNESSIRIIIKNTAPFESKGTILVPKGILPGWIVSQPLPKDIPPHKETEFIIPVHIDVWTNKNITITALSEDGRYCGASVVSISKPQYFKTSYCCWLFVLFSAFVVIIFLYHKKIKFLWKKQ